MIRFEPLKNKPQMLRCLTRLNLGAFNELLPAFKRAYEEDMEKRDRRRKRGAEGNLDGDRRQAGVILFYFRVYPVQMAQDYFFGMGQSQADEWIHRLTPV
jgi:hypothetical protein